MATRRKNGQRKKESENVKGLLERDMGRERERERDNERDRDTERDREGVK